MASYKIKDLENLTGIKAHTIRIWEKRYGLIKPSRTASKIRTYSDLELKKLLNISILNNKGLKISHIAELNDNELNSRILSFNSSNTSVVHEQLLLALIELDEALFSKTLNEQFLEIGIVASYENYVYPFLEKLGIMWLAGTIHPAQEHFISNLIRQKIIAEIDKIEIKENSKKVILFLPEHETHELSLLFYHFILKFNGFQVYYLGQSMPYDSLLKCIDKINADFLVTSWIVSVDETFILDYFKNLKNKFNLPLFAGGYQIKQNLENLSPYVNLIDSSNFHQLMV